MGDCWRIEEKSQTERRLTCPSTPFPMPGYFSKPRYDVHTPPTQFWNRHPTYPQPDHSQFGASPPSFRHHGRATTYPFPTGPTPSSPFPIPQLICGAQYFWGVPIIYQICCKPSQTVTSAETVGLGSRRGSGAGQPLIRMGLVSVVVVFLSLSRLRRFELASSKISQWYIVSINLRGWFSSLGHGFKYWILEQRIYLYDIY